MIVRCGRCQIELEIAGPGEFLCPSCGTRNVARDKESQSPLGLTDLGSGGPNSESEPANVRWVVCPACSFRFALGEVERVACPSCAAALEVSENGVKQVSEA